jgi:hypothetical protein
MESDTINYVLHDSLSSVFWTDLMTSASNEMFPFAQKFCKLIIIQVFFSPSSVHNFDEYSVIILSDNYCFSLTTVIPPFVWAVG